jgi:hypothetical protein
MNVNGGSVLRGSPIGGPLVAGDSARASASRMEARKRFDRAGDERADGVVERRAILIT